jgi:hypothetical protein
MRTKVTLVLIFLNVALFFFIFKFERKWRTEAASLEARRRVFGPEAADIRSIEVTSTAPNGSFALVRNRDTWFLTKPLDWPANAHAATAIATELQMLENEASFSVADLAKTNQSLADFGLDKPKLTIAFSSSDPAAGSGTRPTTLLRIGDTSKEGKRLYVLSPSGDRIHVVKRSLVDTLSVPLDTLRSDTLLSVRVFEARSLSVRTSGAASVPVRIRFDGQRWNFETPINARANKTAVELTINELNALHPKSFPSPSSAPTPATAHLLRVVLEGNNRQETLFIGEPVAPPGPAAAGGAPVATEYFAQLENRNAVFTVVVPPSLMNKLRNAQENMREKRFMEFDPGMVSEIKIAAPVQPNIPELVLQRLEPSAGQAANAAASWQIVRRAAGAQASQTTPADRAAVQRLLDQLSLLSAERFKSDAPTTADLEEWGFNRPLREVTLTLAGSTAPIVLRIGSDANRTSPTFYAQVAVPNEPAKSGYVYQVGVDVERQLPLAPIVWRDRAVMPPLPPAARVSLLKITDLEDKKTLSETTFDAAGAPTAVPRDPKAVEAVVTALRNLRAKEFLAGGFTEKVAAAGDDRPWRFQLEAVIALPGVAGVEQANTFTLLLTERLGGTQQYAGSKELDTVFALEQPLVDALWSLCYGTRDPGPRLEPKK